MLIFNLLYSATRWPVLDLFNHVTNEYSFESSCNRLFAPGVT